MERIRRRVPLADRRRVRTKPERGGPIERLQEVSDILATASSSSPTRVRAALKEFADLRIDLKVLAAQVLLQRVESSYLRPEIVGWFVGLWTDNVLGDARNCWGDEGESGLRLKASVAPRDIPVGR